MTFADELFCRRGHVLIEGINQASVADRQWHRRIAESEAAFLARIRLDAAAAGYTAIAIGGLINVAPRRHLAAERPDRRKPSPPTPPFNQSKGPPNMATEFAKNEVDRHLRDHNTASNPTGAAIAEAARRGNDVPSPEAAPFTDKGTVSRILPRTGVNHIAPDQRDVQQSPGLASQNR
jgi:hypothetical protein